MKIRNSSRIVAIVLALMMIVPLISVPAFATTEKVDGTTADGEKVTPIASDDFENYEVGLAAVNNGLRVAPPTAVIADLNGNKVIKYDIKPATTNDNGSYFIATNQGKNGSDYSVAQITGAKMDTETQKILYDGTATMGGLTYYFKGATLNNDKFETACKLYSDAEYTTEYGGTWYFITAQVRNAMQGQVNVAQPSWLAGNFQGATGKVFVVQADYYIDSNMSNKSIDVRIDNENGKNVEIATLAAVDGGVKVRLHTDMSTKVYDSQPTIARDTWFTLTAVLEAKINNGYSTTLYVNGELIAYGESTKTGTFNGSKNGFNLGHTARNAAVSTYYGNYYVDNVAVYDTLDVIPDSWTKVNGSFNEDFEEGTFPASSSISWTGSSKNVVEKDGNWCLELPAYDGGNVDKRINVNGIAANSGIIRIDTDYYLPSDAAYGFQGQFSHVVGDRSSTLGGTADKATKASVTWVDLYFIRVRNGVAWLNSVGAGNSSKPTYLMKNLPTDEFFTLSTLIDLETGEAAILVNGEMAAHFWMYRTDGFLTNMSFGFGQLLVGKINSYKTSGMTDVGYYTGSLYVDNIKVSAADELPELSVPSTTYDFENATVGAKPVAPDSSYAFTSTATYGYLDTLDTKFVEISMLGDCEATTLTTPFFVTNLRSYDLTVSVDSFEAPDEVTLEFLENEMTFTNSADGYKPVYYAYVASENTVYVYNNGGNKATEDNIDGFKLETYTIGEANYNSMYRTICGGLDTNIDKSFRVSHGALCLPGTYVLSADYFVANDANGDVQSQSYNATQRKWLDFYHLDLTAKKFYVQAGGIVEGKDGQDLLVDQWNTVTMIVTVKDDLTCSVDIYLNGVYTFSKNFSYAFEANSWSIAKPSKPSNLDKAQSLSGFIRVDNVKVNAVAYDENDIQTIDASNVLGFDIEFADGKFLSLTNVSDSTELKLYGATYVNAMTTDFLNMRVGNIVTTADKASIRLKNDEIGTGLRFATEINAATLAFLDQMIAAGQIKSYNYGTLIAPTDYLSEDKDLSFENFTEDVDMLDVEASLGKFYSIDDDESTTHFVGSITNIFPSNYNRAFSGRGYFQVTLRNGQVVTYYSDYTHSVSVAEQALTTINMGVYEEGSDAYNILAGFAGLQ